MKQIACQEGPLSKEVMGITWGPGLISDRHLVKKDCVGLIKNDGEGNGTPLQYSCLENPMDGGAWWAVVHGVEKSRT